MSLKKLTYDERKKQILEIAFELFAKNGFKKTTTKIIAQKAGISEALLYKHFSSKTELYNAIRDYTKNKIKNSLDKSFSQIPDFNSLEELKNILKSFILEFLKNVRSNPNLIRIILYAKLEDPEFSSLFIKPDNMSDKPIQNLFNKAIDKNLIKNIDIRLISKYFFSIFNTLQDFHSKEEEYLNTSITNEKELNQKIDSLFEIFFHGLAN